MVVAVVILLAVLASNTKSTNQVKVPIQAVVGENFWGNLLSQLGGSKVRVTSIVSDPNADPHEYESNTTDARAFANASYVVINGAGYDTWADKLLGANPVASRKVLKVADLLNKREGDNPHFWYSPIYVNSVIAAMKQDLIKLDPGDSGYFNKQYNLLTQNLSGYQNRIKQIKSQFGGTKVAATEDIFAYLAQAAGLNLISPPAFIQAVAEGNDPPADSITVFQQQLSSNEVKVLVYNEQTVTPLTDNIKKLAGDQNIPIVGVTETIQPPNTSFEDWMNAELINLTNALNAGALGT